MKRCKSLAGLSRQHHTALVLAKNAQWFATTSPEAAGPFMAQAVATFERDTEPHFRVEEEQLLPLLTAAGKLAPVQRTLADHENLRRLVRRLGENDISCLKEFGVALEAHVRFEEREMFALAEAILPPEALAVLEHNHQRAGV